MPVRKLGESESFRCCIGSGGDLLSAEGEEALSEQGKAAGAIADRGPKCATCAVPLEKKFNLREESDTGFGGTDVYQCPDCKDIVEIGR